jgi:hypothetical protein
MRVVVWVYDNAARVLYTASSYLSHFCKTDAGVNHGDQQFPFRNILKHPSLLALQVRLRRRKLPDIDICGSSLESLRLPLRSGYNLSTQYRVLGLNKGCNSAE